MDQAQRKSKLFFIVTFVVTMYLIFSFPEHTTEMKRARGWYTQPFVAPLVGLSVLAFFSFLKLLTILRPQPDDDTIVRGLIDNLPYYQVVLITGTLFIVYIYAIGVIGFAASTLLFVLSLLWLSRLLTWFWAFYALVAVTLIVLIFRVGVNIWFPDVTLYETLFSGELLYFMNSYL